MKNLQVQGQIADSAKNCTTEQTGFSGVGADAAEYCGKQIADPVKSCTDGAGGFTVVHGQNRADPSARL